MNSRDATYRAVFIGLWYILCTRPWIVTRPLHPKRHNCPIGISGGDALAIPMVLVMLIGASVESCASVDAASATLCRAAWAATNTEYANPEEQQLYATYARQETMRDVWGVCVS
jgi:hypothetical protein